MARLYQRRQSRAISALPPLFDYYAYMFHFTGLLGGPTIYYTEYEDVMSKPAKRERYPAVLRTLLTGMMAFALFGATCQWHSLDDFLDPSIREKSLFSRLIVLYVFMLGMRCKYYGLWKLGESMCLLNGFGENEKTHEWSNMSNVDIMGFEFATNYSTTARTWNCRIQQWLQYCIYERSNFNQFLVFMVSAFWHGFYPGYYIGFSLASFMTHVGRLAYKKVWPRVEGTAYQSVFKMAMMMLCAYTNSWMLIAHMSYTVSRTMQIWRNFDFVHPVLLVVLCVLFTVMPTPKMKADCCVCCKQGNVKLTSAFYSTRHSILWRFSDFTSILWHVRKRHQWNQRDPENPLQPSNSLHRQRCRIFSVSFPEDPKPPPDAKAPQTGSVAGRVDL